MLLPALSKKNINDMYILYTFLLGNNLPKSLVLEVSGAVALPVTLPLAVVALHPSPDLGLLRSTVGNLLAFLLLTWMPGLLVPFTRLLVVDRLVDHQHVVLLLDLDLSMLEHGEELIKSLAHALHVVVQHKALVARGQRLQHPINSQSCWNLEIQCLKALNAARNLDHVLT